VVHTAPTSFQSKGVFNNILVVFVLFGTQFQEEKKGVSLNAKGVGVTVVAPYNKLSLPT